MSERDRWVWAYVLYREVSDQYGTSEVVGVYSTVDLARAAGATIKDRRTFIASWVMDQSISAKPQGGNWTQ